MRIAASDTATRVLACKVLAGFEEQHPSLMHRVFSRAEVEERLLVLVRDEQDPDLAMTYLQAVCSCVRDVNVEILPPSPLVDRWAYWSSPRHSDGLARAAGFRRLLSPEIGEIMNSVLKKFHHMEVGGETLDDPTQWGLVDTREGSVSVDAGRATGSGGGSGGSLAELQTDGEMASMAGQGQQSRDGTFSSSARGTTATKLLFEAGAGSGLIGGLTTHRADGLSLAISLAVSVRRACCDDPLLTIVRDAVDTSIVPYIPLALASLTAHTSRMAAAHVAVDRHSYMGSDEEEEEEEEEVGADAVVGGAAMMERGSTGPWSRDEPVMERLASSTLEAVLEILCVDNLRQYRNYSYSFPLVYSVVQLMSHYSSNQTLQKRALGCLRVLAQCQVDLTLIADSAALPLYRVTVSCPHDRAMMGDFVTIIHSLVAHPIARGRCCPSLVREGIHRPLWAVLLRRWPEEVALAMTCLRRLLACGDGAERKVASELEEAASDRRTFVMSSTISSDTEKSTTPAIERLLAALDKLTSYEALYTAKNVEILVTGARLLSAIIKTDVGIGGGSKGKGRGKGKDMSKLIVTESKEQERTILKNIRSVHTKITNCISGQMGPGGTLDLNYPALEGHLLEQAEKALREFPKLAACVIM